VVALDVVEVALAGAVASAVEAVGVVVRLTNRGLAGATGVLVVPDPPEPLPEAEPPVDPRVVLTAVIRCAPGRNTTCPSVTVPVCVSPRAAWQRSTAAVVAASNVSSTVI
jgi:hypothetical protein